MSTGEKTKTAASKDSGRVRYRLTGEQVFKMLDAGILPDADFELWNGTLFLMTKGEPHNFVVGQTGDLLRKVVGDSYHVREEKSTRHGKHSLPEPDLAIARGGRGAYGNLPPRLSDLALLAEVCHTTESADRGVKLRRYAEVGVPVYWVLDVIHRRVEVYQNPLGRKNQALYQERAIHSDGQDFPVILDGREVGRLTVSDLFPAETKVGNGS